MTEWLLSGHNTQESTGLACPVTVTMTEKGLDTQIDWFLSQLAGDTSDFDRSLKPTGVVQGRLYLNINYYARNMAAVLPFDSESVGAPAGMVEVTGRATLSRRLLLLPRFRRTYRWAADFYQHVLPDLDRELYDIYWRLREGENPLPLIWSLFEPEFYRRARDTDRAHVVAALTIIALDGFLRQHAPQLLSLFAGQETTTSLIGQRIWELCRVARECGPEVQELLLAGETDLAVYRLLPQAEPFVAGVQDFLRAYGHRGFRYEADLETERLADRPDHVLLAVAGQLRLGEAESPEARAEAARRLGLEALDRMNPFRRAFWQRFLRWSRRLISWREDSKSNLALRQAVYGLAARLLSRHYYPNDPDDAMMFYTVDELLAFARSRGEERVERQTLEWRRAQYELRRTQPPPPELIWYDPETGRWRPAAQAEEESLQASISRLEGIAASAGSGPAGGVAVVTNDPLDAARRLLELDGPAVLITHLTDPAWSSLFRRLSGVVTELGGVISHAAIVARENGLPAVVGIPDATRLIRDGQRVRVDGANGVVEILD